MFDRAEKGLGGESGLEHCVGSGGPRHVFLVVVVNQDQTGELGPLGLELLEHPSDVAIPQVGIQQDQPGRAGGDPLLAGAGVVGRFDER
jgi:hypothetical protein